ncbi:chromosome segregation protein SMC [Pimelobacter simplex]|uniref:Chromosome partition protein Smc n=1 Tax=Nocardioides simplex TaxID=2045 RepID=A0A0A1DNV4_NOCSI|nr:chromosome segregation protein SMC [Pimelobacter simplex]AIY18243.1 Chromosome partition protein smc [Pimelobacter simplex]MCG8153476.1 chromosome segregation protein SMC [Pimelobacter simplex]GEB15857.1 chromosome partition protein Smc [Pimelobacter simplex]SFN11903.1 condensin subunit Smc [Pimelobacter simplex]
MYLKSLTLKGFKSFASATTLQLEPGITCIVGPNGSGKSNVVDALAWVMGEASAKSLRGGKMDDVIFAGTSGRPPLGRAEVVLTIDNSDGALPIEYSEVTISRTMFRTGGSEYAINGTTCRLLDVQELLSDSGIGREMHVIVGQGQLDQILHATPEDRRGFIEEAAGVLKHRKRKEKALRKLDSTEGNLNRLNDLLSEIRRQLKPLGRQAEVARRAATVQADVRDARARLLADDLVTARTSLEQELADESVLLQRREEVEAAITAAREQEATLEAALREDLPALSAAQETLSSLQALRERFRGTQSLAAERVRNAAGVAEAEVETGRDPDELDAEAARLAAHEAEIAALVAEQQAALEAAVAARRASEDAAAAEERRVAGLLRAAADRREGLARLHGQVNTLRSRATAAEEEIGRLEAARTDAIARADRSQRDFTALETRVAGLDAGEEGLDAEHEAAVASFDDLEERLAKVREEAQQADRDKAGLTARKEALELGLARKDGAGALLAASDEISGLLGSVAALVTVRSGYEGAVAAALGAAADAVAVTDADTAVAAIDHLKTEDLGRAGLLLGGGESETPASWPALPAGVAYAATVVECPAPVRPALNRLLRKVAVVDDLPAARALVADLADVVAVTRDGDLFGAHFASGGSHATQSLIEIQAAVDEATEALATAVADAERLSFDLARIENERAEAKQRVDVALAKLHESDATLAAVAEELGQHGSLARAARAEAERMTEAIAQAETSREQALVGLAELEQRLASAEQDSDEEPDTTEQERLVEATRAARQTEMEARLALRTSEERGRALHGRVDQMRKAAEAERVSRARAAERRERLLAEGRAGQAVATAVTFVLARLEASIDEATARRTSVEDSRRGREHELMGVRQALRDLGKEHGELISSVHRDEMARAQQRMRIEQIETKALEELGLEPDGLIADYGPDQPVPVLEPAVAVPRTVPYVRDEQVKRLKSAEKALSMLGKVNPLALEEFSAMEERHQFLSEQLEDLRQTRKDLLDIVKDVDARVEAVFTEAYADVTKAFDQTFARLFPGGEGRLVLTDPANMLTTGIEVEARPPGKKVKRLSLLSGGERSLVAVAFLVALFKARPSPFYILDEVEAALDDTNLGRLLEIYEELRENSQLLVITHQKRTMEVGDALYGVTMRGDGVSAVISQRLRDESA